MGDPLQGIDPLQVVTLLISFAIAFVTNVAGVWMMRYGFKLTKQQTDLLGLKPTIDEGLRLAQEAAVKASGSTQGTSSRIVGSASDSQEEQVTQPSPQAFGGPAEYVRGLAELAKSLGGLTPAVAAFVVSTILFFFSTSIVTALIVAVL